MATNLYETLGLSRDATPEQIRKAYRKRALETHPDRLPQGASSADKVRSEEMFRKVNNAYEVLSDPENRKSYDQYGVWPPPTAHENYTQGNWKGPSRDPFDDSFFKDPPFSRDPFFGRARQTDPFGFFGSSRHPHFQGFTDPFVLFNQIFGDLHRAFSRDPHDDPFGHWDDDFFGPGLMSPMSMLQIGNSPFGFPTGGNANVYSSSSRGRLGGPSGSKWVTESYSTSNVNGVTYTKAVRRDSEGNEHVTYSYPNGNERRLINGVEQPSYGSYPPPPQHNTRAISPPPFPSPPQHNTYASPYAQHNGYPIAQPLPPPQAPPPPYDTRPHSPPGAVSRHVSRDQRNVRFQDYTRAPPQDPYAKHDPYSEPVIPQYADPNSSGYHHKQQAYGGNGEAHDPRGGSSWKFWK